MSVLRRRTSNILAGLFLVSITCALVGAVIVVWREPAIALKVLAAGGIAGIGLARAAGELRWGDTLRSGAMIGAPLTVLGLGAYALYAFAGVPGNVVVAILVAAVALVIVILARSLIAGGSADYPYDD